MYTMNESFQIDMVIAEPDEATERIIPFEEMWTVVTCSSHVKYPYVYMISAFYV